MPPTTDHPYKTTELEVASFLKASGHQLIDVVAHGRLVEFSFDAAAQETVRGYFAGAELPARELFEAHRSLRALIQQVKEHKYKRNGTENRWDNTR